MEKNFLNQDFIKTYCRFCLGSCGIKVFKKKGIVKILSDKENPHSRGYFCKKGAKIYDYYNKENRIFDYSIRNKIIDEKSFFISLSTDLQRIIKKFGPDSIGIYFGTHAILDAAGIWNGMGFLLRIGSNSMFTVSSIDNIDKTFVSHHLTRGKNAGLINIADIENSKTILIVGSNPIISNGHLYSNINFKRKLIELNKKKGGFSICLDPKKTSTADYCSEHLQIVPNTDWLVLLYICKLYIKSVGERKFLKNLRSKKNKNVDMFFLILKKLNIEIVEKFTNSTKLQLKKIAEEYIKSDSFCFISGTGVSFSETSIISEWLLWILSSSKNHKEVTKNFIRGANEVSKETIKKTPNFSSRFTPDKKFARSNELPCSAIKSVVNKEKLKALIVFGGNPMSAFPSNIKDALKKLDVLVSLNTHTNSTTKLSNYIVPVAGQLERDDATAYTGFNKSNNVQQITKKIFNTNKGIIESWNFFSKLGDAMNIDVANLGISTSNLSAFDIINSINKTKLDIPNYYPNNSNFTSKEKKLSIFDCSPQHSPDFFSLIFISELKKKFERILSSKKNSNYRDFYLISGRLSENLNSAIVTDNLKEKNCVFMNPLDIETLNLKVKKDIKITSLINNNSIKAKLFADANIKKNVICIPQSDSVPNVSYLCDDKKVHDWTSMPTQTGIKVKIN